MHVHETTQKQLDWGVYPKTRNLTDGIPSLVLEVGISQSWVDLQRDAREWLTRFNHLVGWWHPYYSSLTRSR